MINFIHSRIFRPEKGWDPVPKSHAETYSEKEWDKLDRAALDGLESKLGGFKGKRILDLGGGPGQYSIAFAERGASVVWHDISSNYREILLRKAAEHGVEIECSLGYLEDAVKFGPAEFDLVFCRICWYYCRSDDLFARMVLALLKSGGTAYIDVPTSRGRVSKSPWARIQAGVYRTSGYKLGHPFPPPGRIPALFAELSPRRLEVDFSSGKNDKILLVK